MTNRIAMAMAMPMAEAEAIAKPNVIVETEIKLIMLEWVDTSLSARDPNKKKTVTVLW